MSIHGDVIQCEKAEQKQTDIRDRQRHAQSEEVYCKPKHKQTGGPTYQPAQPTDIRDRQTYSEREGYRRQDINIQRPSRLETVRHRADLPDRQTETHT